MSGCQHESGRVIQELSATKTYCVGIVLSGFTPRVRPEFLRLLGLYMYVDVLG
jgi:hypothetical protein